MYNQRYPNDPVSPISQVPRMQQIPQMAQMLQFVQLVPASLNVILPEAQLEAPVDLSSTGSSQFHSSPLPLTSESDEHDVSQPAASPQQVHAQGAMRVEGLGVVPCTSSQGMDEGKVRGEGEEASQDGSRPTRRKGKPIPDRLKDDNYYARRERNNESAQRSREKEDRMAAENEAKLIRLTKKVAELEAENAVYERHAAVLREMLNSLQSGTGYDVGHPI